MANSKINKPIRVAQVIGMAVNGGVESFVMNYYRNIDRNKVQFDFLVESTSRIINKDKIEEMGGKVIFIPSYKNIIKYVSTLIKVFKENKYDIVHSNMNALSVFSLYAAKKAGVKVRIANSLSMSNKKEKLRNFIKNILKIFSKKYATHYFACSNLCGKWLYGKNIILSNKYYKINNAVEIKKYQYNADARKSMQNIYNLHDRFVVGTIGRLESQKNQFFLLNIFYELKKKKANAYLIIIGDGSLYERLNKKINMLKIRDSAMILTSEDVSFMKSVCVYYNLFDVFLLPSLYEGLPTVGIEAQLNNLHCFFSSNITRETAISNNAHFISLSEKPETWANEILKNINTNRNQLKYCKEYDISIQSKYLVSIYEKILREG